MYIFNSRSGLLTVKADAEMGRENAWKSEEEPSVINTICHFDVTFPQVFRYHSNEHRKGGSID